MEIVRVGALDNRLLDIELSSGHIILFDVSVLLPDEEYRQLLEDDRFCRPQTDGGSVFWANGPYLTLQEILSRLES